MDPRRRAPRREALTLFTQSAEGRYYLCPRALNSHTWSTEDSQIVPDSAYIDTVRQNLEGDRLRLFGYGGELEDIPDSAIAAAVMCGVVTTPAFHEIVNSLLVPNPCLCCYSTRTRSRAENVEAQIRLLLKYYDQKSYENANVFYRTLSGFVRDIDPDEKPHILEVAPPRASRHMAEAVRAANEVPGVCITYTYHREKPIMAADLGLTGALTEKGITVCAYSSPESRRFLRRLGKQCKLENLTLTTRIAVGTGYGFFCLRDKLRVYAVDCHFMPGSDSSSLRAFWRCVKNTAKIE